MDKQTTLKSRYQELLPHRQPYIDAAIESASYTIPSQFPESLASDEQRKPITPAEIESCWHSIGQRGVSNLASKLLLALFPPNTPFFNLSLSPTVVEQAAEQGNMTPEEVKTEARSAFSRIEKSAIDALEATSFRADGYEALRQLIIAGNVCLGISIDGFRVHRLNKYVCTRDGAGNPVEVIIKECLTYQTLPAEVREAVKDRISKPGTDDEIKPDHPVDVYTACVLRDDKWHVSQEAEGVKLPGSEGTYNKDEPPFIPLRFVRISGEDYGRGYVEELLGDLRVLNSLTETIDLGSAEAANILKLIRPGSTIRPEDLKKRTGHVAYGRHDDINVVVSGKVMDLQVAQSTADRTERRLEMAFLLTSPRDAERVTAEEIRLLARQLEDALGGVYSAISQEFQRPLVRRYLNVLSKQGRIEQLPHKLIDLRIVTGIDALGRGHEQDRLDAFVGRVREQLGDETAALWLNVPAILSDMKTNLGVVTDVLRSKEEVEAEMEQRQQQAMLQQNAPELIKQGGAMIRDQQNREAAAPA